MARTSLENLNLLYRKTNRTTTKKAKKGDQSSKGAAHSRRRDWFPSFGLQLNHALAAAFSRAAGDCAAFGAKIRTAGCHSSAATEIRQTRGFAALGANVTHNCHLLEKHLA